MKKAKDEGATRGIEGGPGGKARAVNGLIASLYLVRSARNSIFMYRLALSAQPHRGLSV